MSTEMRYSAVPEETLYIDLPDTENLRIKGVLRGTLEQPLVVMMHGRSGTGNSLLQYLGARYLYERGFATLRLWMYGHEPDTRNIVDCTLDTHVADFETVVAYLRGKGVKQLFATGHSYGGATILKSTARLQAAVLWDPSHGSYWSNDVFDKRTNEKEIDDIVVGTSGKGYVIPRSMKEFDYSTGDTTEWAAHKGYPLEVISAGAGKIAELGKRYTDAADEPKKHVVITGAQHQFEDSDDVTLQLFSETADWLKECLND